MLTVTVILDGIWYSLHIWWLFRPAKQPGFCRWRVWSLYDPSFREKWFEAFQGWRMMWQFFPDNCYPPIFFMSPKKGPLYKGIFIFQASCFRWHVSFIVKAARFNNRGIWWTWFLNMGNWIVSSPWSQKSWWSWCLPLDFEALLVQDILAACFGCRSPGPCVCFFPLV